CDPTGEQHALRFNLGGNHERPPTRHALRLGVGVGFGAYQRVDSSRRAARAIQRRQGFGNGPRGRPVVDGRAHRAEVDHHPAGRSALSVLIKRRNEMKSAKGVLLFTLASMAAWSQVNIGEKKPEASLPFTMNTVATFELPWRIAFLPDGRMLVTE